MWSVLMNQHAHHHHDLNDIDEETITDEQKHEQSRIHNARDDTPNEEDEAHNQ